MVGGTRNRSPPSGGVARTSSSGRQSCGSSSAQALTRSSGCDVGGHVGEVELGHLRDRVEDRSELARQPVDLVVGEIEARESRHMQHLFRVIAIVDPSFQKTAGPSWGPAAGLAS